MNICIHIELFSHSLLNAYTYTQYFIYNENILSEIYIAYCEHTCAKK